MTGGSVARSRAAARDWLLAQDAPEAVIAAHEGGTAEDQDAATRWVRRLLDGQDSHGSWGGDLMATACALMTLEEIRTAAALREQDPGVGRALDWIRARRSVPGAWSDGCTPRRHGLGLCHHFLGGFFSPAPPEVPMEDVALRNGVAATSDGEARFIASATALRCMLPWTRATGDARLHLEGLRRVVDSWPELSSLRLTTASLLAAIHVLLQSPVAEDRAAAGRGLRLVGGKQRGDGSWVDMDPFQALEVFAQARAEDVGGEQAHGALWHGARLLTSTQKADGSWGGDRPARRVLIAWRTLRIVDPGA